MDEVIPNHIESGIHLQRMMSAPVNLVIFNRVAITDSIVGVVRPDGDEPTRIVASRLDGPAPVDGAMMYPVVRILGFLGRPDRENIDTVVRRPRPVRQGAMGDFVVI